MPSGEARLRVVRSPQQVRRAALDREWDKFSANIRDARPWCEASLVLAAIWLDDPNPDCRARVACRRAAAACQGKTANVHHKHPTGGGGLYVPSQGLTDADVVAICGACHSFVHGCGWPVVRFERYDLLRPWWTETGDAA
jgi:hypothetical protein